MFLCLWFVFMSERDLSELEVDETSPWGRTLEVAETGCGPLVEVRIPWGENDHCFL